MPLPDLSFEQEAGRQGFRFIAGIDEAGRGSLAGPVVAAAVILPTGLMIAGVNDSKKLTPGRREVLYQIILRHALATGIGIVGSEDIDRINILRATIRAMEMAVKDLQVPPDYLLIDAVALPESRIPQRPIIKGDTLSVSIAAASIIAKVTRDRLMTEAHSLSPQYNFMTHKGYATKDHVSRLRLYGPSILHRKSFLKRLLGSDTPL